MTGCPRSMLLIVPTTPTMVNFGAVGPPRWICWPMAFPVGEVLLRQVFVDDARPARLSAVSLVVEDAALEQRDVHRLEVVAADDFLPAVRRGLARPLRAADDRVGPGADVAVERHVGGRCRRRHAGNRARLLEQARPERAIRGRVGIARRRQRDLRGEHVVGREPGIDALQPREALDQQAGADQQHHREHRLRDDERPRASRRCPCWPCRCGCRLSGTRPRCRA